MSTKEWNMVEVQRKFERNPDNYVKIDGVKIQGLQDIKIEFGITEPYPLITIKFLAKELKGKIGADVTIEMEKAWNKIKPIKVRKK